MRYAVKRDFYLSRGFLIWIGLLLPFIYIINMPYLFIFIYGFTLLLLVFNVFYHDNKNNVNAFSVSTPVNMKHMIAGRYLFFTSVLLMLPIYHLLIDTVASLSLPYLEETPVTIRYLFVLFTLCNSILSGIMLLLYIAELFTRTIIFQSTLLFLNSILFAMFIAPMPGFITYYSPLFNIIKVQNAYLSFIIVGMCLILSYSISSRMITMKDAI